MKKKKKAQNKAESARDFLSLLPDTGWARRQKASSAAAAAAQCESASPEACELPAPPQTRRVTQAQSWRVGTEAGHQLQTQGCQMASSSGASQPLVAPIPCRNRVRAQGQGGLPVAEETAWCQGTLQACEPAPNSPIQKAQM